MAYWQVDFRQAEIRASGPLAARNFRLEFFLKNRHLRGFDTPAKALVTAVKEALDNALDACEEAGLLPDITVELGDRFGKSRMVVEDNGLGIVAARSRAFSASCYTARAFTS